MNACQKRIEELLAEQPAADEKKTPQRDAHGRFATGNSGGPGNPFGRYTAKLREALVTAVTEEDMRAIVRKMIDMAKVGSIPAMRLVMQYVIGKPTSAPNPDRQDADEWSVHKETAAMTADVSAVVKSLEPEACLDLVRNVRPIMSDLAMEKYGKSVLPERTSEQESTSPPHGFDGESPTASGHETAREAPSGFDGGELNTPHPQPLSPEYRGEGRTLGRSVLPERTSEQESTSPPHGFDGESPTARGHETAREAPAGFDGGESNTPHPQPLSPEYRGEGGTGGLPKRGE